MVPPTAVIGIDWGTSGFRAWRLGTDGAVLAAKTAAAGIMAVPNGDFAAVLEREIGPWLAPGVPVIASGMIGSRQGWLEAPYCPCPAGLEAIAAALVVHPSWPGLHIVPGVMQRDAAGLPDVIRGEETQIIGLPEAAGPALIVLPGTHSKWVLAEGGRIARFTTFMTGEVFAVLKAHSILGRTMRGERVDGGAFARGLAVARETPGILQRLFSVRTLALFDELPPEAGASYLSGLLIGHEVGEALAGPATPPGAITLIGEATLCELYREALAAAGRTVRRGGEDAAARGHWRIARAAGLA